MRVNSFNGANAKRNKYIISLRLKVLIIHVIDLHVVCICGVH